MLYAASTAGFYDKLIHGQNVPDDALEISDEEYQRLLAAQAEGKEIVPGADGRPVTSDPAPATLQQLASAALMLRDDYLAKAAIRIAPLQDANDLGEATDQEAASLVGWKKFRIELNRIPQQTGFPTDIVWPAMPDSTA